MNLSSRNDQICVLRLYRDTQIQRALLSSVLTIALMVATIIVGLTGLGTLSA